MGEDMLGFLQVLYLELILVEVGLPLLQLIRDFLPLLLQHLDLLDLLLQLCLDYGLLGLSLAHAVLLPFTLLLELPLLCFDVLLLFQVLFVLFFEFLAIFDMLLLDIDDLVFMAILHAVQLLVVHTLEGDAGLFGVDVFCLDLDHVGLELLQEFINGPLVLPFQLRDTLLIVLLHLKFLLLELKEVAALNVEFTLVDIL